MVLVPSLIRIKGLYSPRLFRAEATAFREGVDILGEGSLGVSDLTEASYQDPEGK